MSFDLYQWRDAVFASDVSRSVLSTAWALSKFANNTTGLLYPKQDTIADYSRTPIGTVRRHLKELEKVGLLEVSTVQMGTDRKWSKNTYRLITPPELYASVGTGQELGAPEDLYPEVNIGQEQSAVDLSASVDTGAVDISGPVCISGPTCTHSEPDLCAFEPRPVLSSARHELPSELPTQLPKEITASSVAKPSPTREARFVGTVVPTQMDRPLMAVVPDLAPEQEADENRSSLDERGRNILGGGISSWHEAIEYVNDHRPASNPMTPFEERELREALRTRVDPSILLSEFARTRTGATA